MITNVASFRLTLATFFLIILSISFKPALVFFFRPLIFAFFQLIIFLFSQPLTVALFRRHLFFYFLLVLYFFDLSLFSLIALVVLDLTGQAHLQEWLNWWISLGFIVWTWIRFLSSSSCWLLFLQSQRQILHHFLRNFWWFFSNEAALISHQDLWIHYETISDLNSLDSFQRCSLKLLFLQTPLHHWMLNQSKGLKVWEDLP